MVKHFTATTYLFNPSFTKTLMLLHPKLKTWLPPGGHMQENETPSEAATREINEEIGAYDIDFINNYDGLDFSDSRTEMLLRPHFIMSQLIEKDHYHLDMIFFAKVEEKDYSSPEKHLLKWFTKDDLDQEKNIFENVKNLGLFGFKEFI